MRLRTKLIRAMVGTLAVVFGATLLTVGYLNYRSARGTLETIETHIQQSIARKGQGLAANHALALRPLVADNAFGDVTRLVQQSVRQDDEMVYGLFLGADGRPWAYVHRGDEGGAPSPDEWRELQIAPEAGRSPGLQSARRLVFGERVFEFSAAVDGDDGATLGRIFYGLSSVPLDRALSAARREFQRSLVLTLSLLVLLGAVAMLLGVGIIRNLSQRITRPLAHLTEVTTAIAAGAKHERVSIDSDDEIGVLGQAFNNMLGRLDDSYERLEGLNRTLEQRVEARTHELAQRNRDMRLVLDNVNQGFLTISRDGVLAQERSAIVDRWFGRSQETRTTFWAYLAPHHRDFSELFQLGYEALLEGTLPLSLCVDQLPKQLSIGGRELSFAYHPIHEEAAFAGLLIVVNDVTEERLHARQEAEQGEVLAMFRAFSHDRTGFLAFFDEASRMLETLGTPGLDSIVRKRLYHTLKGNAALTGFHAVADLCHRAEDRLSEIDEAGLAATLAALRARWDALRETLATLIGERGRDLLEVQSQELDGVLEELRASAAPARVVARLAGWRLEPAEKSLLRLGQHGRSLHRRLGKGDLDVTVDASDVRLDPQRFTGLWSELVHVVRNAVDHGLESSDERRARGKSARPRLQLRASTGGGDLMIEIEDDGRGIEWQAVRRAAVVRGLAAETPEDLTRALLSPGVTTRGKVTATSGRGMGLAAVRDRVEAMGGRITVTSALGQGTKFELRLPLSPPTNDDPLPSNDVVPERRSA